MYTYRGYHHSFATSERVAIFSCETCGAAVAEQSPRAGAAFASQSMRSKHDEFHEQAKRAAQAASMLGPIA